ncbi:MAG: mannitol dehydrogenase family protein, partial [Mycobacteriales bacterium]
MIAPTEPGQPDRLSIAALGRLGGRVSVPAYDVLSASPTVVHIGPGVFHRAHQAAYSDTALSTGDRSGAICAVSLRSAELQHVLTNQDHLYTMVETDNAGERFRVVGAIRESLVARTEPERVLARLSDPAITVVTITVTENGYCSIGSTGALDVTREEIEHDIRAPAAPVSLPGFLVEALRRRRHDGVSPFTVVSCDNLQSNGPATRRVVTELAAHRGGDLAEWIAASVAFPSSMVDRMVPATTESIRTLVEKTTGCADGWPVVTEPFSQWVLEDHFPTGRPRWEAAGVELVGDVRPYEQAKLRILNGAHSAFAYFGLLAGHSEIADAVADPVLRSAVMDMLEYEVIPTLRAPAGTNLTEYAASVIHRFGNRTLGYTTAKVAGDGSQKIPVRILATARDQLAAGRPVQRLAAVVAAYAACVFGPRAIELNVA